MKIYLARHGQSQWQVKPSSNLDTPLTSIGHEQSKRLAEWLAGDRFFDNDTRLDLVSLLVSPRRRALQTARYLVEAVSLPLVTEGSLSEADFRIADHLPQHGPMGFATSTLHSDSLMYAKFKVQAERALNYLVEQATAGQGDVLAITHAGIIETMLRGMVAFDAVRFRPYNAALTIIEWTDHRWHLVHLNFWDHLPVKLRTA